MVYFAENFASIFITDVCVFCFVLIFSYDAFVWLWFQGNTSLIQHIKKSSHFSFFFLYLLLIHSDFLFLLESILLCLSKNFSTSFRLSNCWHFFKIIFRVFLMMVTNNFIFLVSGMNFLISLHVSFLLLLLLKGRYSEHCNVVIRNLDFWFFPRVCDNSLSLFV